MLVYIYSRINGQIKIRATLWQKQLTAEQAAAELLGYPPTTKEPRQ